MIGKLTWLHGREASLVVRTESGLKENVLDINNVETYILIYYILKEGNLLCDIA